MTEETDILCFQRVDATRNMARFYVLTLEPTLFGEVALVRSWGRIGTRGRSKSDLHDGHDEARRAMARHAGRRLSRGYQQR